MWRRTPILVADVDGLRPTPDRVRETLFNWLGFLRSDLTEVRGLDLFAGTGALGFELASRGARHVLMIEKDPRLVARLAALKERLGAEQIEIRVGDALQAARSLAPRSFDIVFLDPPYDSDLLAPALALTRPLLAEGGLIYAETAMPIRADAAAAHGLAIVRQARAGRVCFHLLRADGS